LYNKKKNDFFKFFLKIFCIFWKQKKKKKNRKKFVFFEKISYNTENSNSFL